MREAPRLRGGVAVRTASLFFGLVLIAAAIVSLLESGFGLPPWDVLHMGISKHSPMTLGTASIIVGLVVLFVAWAAGAKPGFGTAANAVVIGLTVDLLLRVDAIVALRASPAPGRAVLLLLGVALFGAGSAFYIGAGLGAGPRDSLMLALSRRTGRRIGAVRTVMEIAVLVSGVVLGGAAGLGTVLVALMLGPSVEGSFWILLRTGLADRPSAEIAAADRAPTEVATAEASE